MPARRTVALDIVGCTFLLYAATLFFAVLRAPYAHTKVPEIVTDIAVYGGLLATCVLVALGIFGRRPVVLWPALLLSLLAFFAGLFAWHVPETAQLPAGVLGAASVVLLLGRRGELADPSQDEPQPGSGPRPSDADLP
jgi:hypothetical protein